MDAPWYATLIGSVAVLIYLWFFCDHLPEGIFSFCRENLLLLTGGDMEKSLVEGYKTRAVEILTEKELDLVEKKLFTPLLASVPDGVSPHSSFTILERDDGMRAVVLRYESKKDYIGTNDDIPELDEDEEEFSPDICIRSEFLGARRLMIVLSKEQLQ
jgi:hypothetical protein